MLTRFHKILIGLLAVQLALAVVILVRGDAHAVEKPQPLLAGFDAATVTRVQVVGNDKTTVDLVNKNGAWVVASSFDYPVEESKVTDLMSQIAKLSAAAPIATQDRRHKQLGVADTDFQRKLVITAGGKDTTLFVGGSAGLRRTAIRFAGDARVYGVTGLSAYAIGNEPKLWVATTYSNIPQEEIAKVTIDRAGTSTVIERQGDKWTTPLTLAQGETIDQDKLAGLVTNVARIELAAPADPKRDATKPTATITIEKTAQDNATPAPTVIDVISDGERYWVKTRGADRAVLVDKAALDDVIGVERSKLVKRVTTQSPPAKTAQKAG